MNLWMHLADRLDPAGVAGHSLGEFSALFAARILPVDQLLELVCLRGRLMDDVVNEDGSMAAILKLKAEQVQELVDSAAAATGQEIRIANYNTPGQFVVSGHAQAVDHVCAGAKPLKGRAMPLPVSNAFHSPYMAEAAADLAGYMDKLDWKDPKLPVYLNVTARPEPDAAALKDIMKRQMTSSVLWIQTIENQYDDGMRSFVELGPKGALSRMISQILKGRDGVRSLSVSTLEQSAAMEDALA
jgi:[acyl-carrier-protein] S-malonyltransferase